MILHCFYCIMFIRIYTTFCDHHQGRCLDQQSGVDSMGCLRCGKGCPLLRKKVKFSLGVLVHFELAGMVEIALM